MPGLPFMKSLQTRFIAMPTSDSAETGPRLKTLRRRSLSGLSRASEPSGATKPGSCTGSAESPGASWLVGHAACALLLGFAAFYALEFLRLLRWRSGEHRTSREIHPAAVFAGAFCLVSIFLMVGPALRCRNLLTSYRMLALSAWAS